MFTQLAGCHPSRWTDADDDDVNFSDGNVNGGTSLWQSNELKNKFLRHPSRLSGDS